MKHKLISLLWILVAAAILTSGCGPSSTPNPGASSTPNTPGTPATPSPTSKSAAQQSQPESNANLSGLNRDGLPIYSFTFTIQFDGSKDWSYRLQSRQSASLREHNLHMEGVDRTLNPGDVRMVTDGSVTWMTGAGTDNECVRFPNNSGMDPEFILPETLAPLPQLVSLLKYVGEEQILGKASEHWKGSGLSIGKWQNASIDLWVEKSSKTLLRWKMQVTGDDPFFGAGTGALAASYEVTGLDAPNIEPVTGCEIAVPLPDSALKIVRLPGMASFETASEAGDIQAFYLESLPKENWAENEPAVQTDGVIGLSYRRGQEVVEIQIRSIEGGGSKVQLIFP